jgi:acid phosphatase (class A)
MLRRAALLLVLTAGCAGHPHEGAPPRSADVVRHPVPKDPVYIDASWYDTLQAQFPPPPSKGDERQRRDEDELIRSQGERTASDCAEAKSEVSVSLAAFFGPPHGPLDATAVARLKPFIERIGNDGDFFIQKLKTKYPRQRPFAYVENVRPCVPKEVTDAYPSGHATLSRLFALILGDLYPEHREALDLRARQIGAHRVLSGMHHPSDIVAGRDIGDLLYKRLRLSPQFQSDFEAERSLGH